MIALHESREKDVNINLWSPEYLSMVLVRVVAILMMARKLPAVKVQGRSLRRIDPVNHWQNPILLLRLCRKNDLRMGSPCQSLFLIGLDRLPGEKQESSCGLCVTGG
jgi:hypothetical protein